jgi:hypothetical protein
VPQVLLQVAGASVVSQALARCLARLVLGPPIRSANPTRPRTVLSPKWRPPQRPRP